MLFQHKWRRIGACQARDAKCHSRRGRGSCVTFFRRGIARGAEAASPHGGRATSEARGSHAQQGRTATEAARRLRPRSEGGLTSGIGPRTGRDLPVQYCTPVQWLRQCLGVCHSAAPPALRAPRGERLPATPGGERELRGPRTALTNNRPEHPKRVVGLPYRVTRNA